MGNPQLLVVSQKEIKMLSKPSFRIVVVVLVLTAALVTLAFVTSSASGRSTALVSALAFHGRGGGALATGVIDPGVLKELADVRQATAKYRDVNVALADGFIRTPSCVADPQLGGMGIHFINPPRLMDPAVDILKPEILLYVEKGGHMKLLGVEYMYAVGAPDAAVPNPAPPSPVIFNRVLDGPMLGHEPGQPPHYDLHVWIWQANPSGMFAMFNPTVKCQ